MVINTNVSAQSSSQLLADSSAKLSKSLARLSSGSRIVNPEDDVAGMAVSMRFDAQTNRISAASSNVSNAISFSQTQNGYLGKVGKALDRMSELAVLAQDVTKSDPDRALYNKEFSELQKYITDIADKKFNDVTLFASASQNVTIDSDATKFTMTGVDLKASSAYTTATGTSTKLDTAENANTALTNVKAAITQLAEDRAQVGANVSRLNLTNEQLSVLKTNIMAANSRIKDVDVAEESTQFARYNILVQSGTAMLAQANASPQSALRLLQ